MNGPVFDIKISPQQTGPAVEQPGNSSLNISAGFGNNQKWLNEMRDEVPAIDSPQPSPSSRSANTLNAADVNNAFRFILNADAPREERVRVLEALADPRSLTPEAIAERDALVNKALEVPLWQRVLGQGPKTDMLAELINFRIECAFPSVAA